MLGPSAGTLRYFRSEEDVAAATDPVSNMVSEDLFQAEDHWLDRLGNVDIALKSPPLSARDALALVTGLTPHLDRCPSG